MSLEKHIEKYGGDFVAIPVTNIRYWNLIERHIGEVLTDCDCRHPKGSTISFEYFDKYDENVSLAYKPLSDYLLF